MRPDQVLAASRYGVYLGAGLRHAAGDRRCRPHTSRSNGRAWRIGRPGLLPTGCCPRPLAATRHTTPLAGRPSDADLMRRTPLIHAAANFAAFLALRGLSINESTFCRMVWK